MGSASLDQGIWKGGGHKYKVKKGGGHTLPSPHIKRSRLTEEIAGIL